MQQSQGTTSFTGMHNHELLKLSASQIELYKAKKVENIYPEYYLIKVKNFNDIAKDTLDQWIYFLKNEEVKEDFQAKGLAEAKEILDYLKCSEEEKENYERYKESLHYQASMYETNYTAAKLEGEKIKAIEIAKKMLQKKADVEFIMEMTGLDKETVLMLEKSE